ncbi:MAG: hypothetical protein ACXW0R_09745 [Gaiellaceae bacterium]
MQLTRGAILAEPEEAAQALHRNGRQTMAVEKPNVLAIIATAVGWFGVGAHHRGIVVS